MIKIVQKKKIEIKLKTFFSCHTVLVATVLVATVLVATVLVATALVPLIICPSISGFRLSKL